MNQERQPMSCVEQIIKKTCITFLIIYIALLVIGVFKVMMDEKFHNAEIVDDHIMRNISDVVRHLPELPKGESITDSPYETQIPDLVQKDIERMLAGEAKDIVYQSKDGLCKLIIYKTPLGEESDISLTYQNLREYPYGSFVELNADFSMYAKNGGIIVYGREDLCCREISYFFVSEEKTFQESLDQYDAYDAKNSIDLFGVDEEFDETRPYICNATLTRKGNEFKIFQSGKQLGKTEIFPGGEIVVWNYIYEYLLDSNNDLYYMYYCTDPEKPWIHFTKVASSIDAITDEVVRVDHIDTGTYATEKLIFNVYSKDNRRYVAIPDLDTELAYGQKYGKHIEDSKYMMPDYSFETVEISDSNVQTIFLTMDTGRSPYLEFYANYMYETESGESVYTRKRIRGLDPEISRDIPSKELQAFCNKAIAPEEYEETVAALKALYAKYE